MRTAIGILVAVALFVVGVGSGGASTLAPVCGPAGAHTLASNATARVYSVGHRVLGCAHNAPRSYRLGRSDNCVSGDRVSPVVVAGLLAAYGSERCGVDDGFTQVMVRRLSDGKMLSKLPATIGARSGESWQTVTALVLKPDRAAAWIAGVAGIGMKPATEVHKDDKTGFVLLDSGAGINTGSLSLHRSQLTWRHGGAGRHATLR